jgi:hypothetical protein
LDVTSRLAALSPEQRALLDRLRGLREQQARPPKVLQPPPVRPVAGPTAVGDWPLTFDQERLLRLHWEDPGLVAWNVDAASHVRGAIDVACLLAAFRALLQRHPAWRATFPVVAGRPVQRIAERGAFDFSLFDLTALPAARREAEGRSALFHRTRERFDLENGPLVRVALAKIGEPEYLFVVTVHHLVTDWITFQVYTRELGRFYEAARTGQPVALPPLPVQFPDYVLWEREWMAGDVLAEHAQFWRRELAGFPMVLDLPGDRPRPPVQSQKGGMIPAKTGPVPAAKLRAVARREGATSFMALLAVVVALLQRLTGREKIVVGSNSANRPRPELSEVFGFFLTQVPFAVDVSGDPSFRELLARAKKAALAAYPYQSFPFAKLIEALGVADDRSRNPVVQVLLLVLDGKSSQSDGEQSSAATALYDGNSRWDLMFGLYDYDDLGFSGPVEYNADIFSRERMERVLSLFYRIVEAVGENPDVHLSQLPVWQEAAA